MTVHHVRIIRGNQVIDVLKATDFQVIQREGFRDGTRSLRWGRVPYARSLCGRLQCDFRALSE